MAKFGINKEGVAALRQLEKDLKSINTEIETSGKTLKAAVSGIGEGLGIYEEKILELVDSVNNTQRTGRESVEQLTGSQDKRGSDQAESAFRYQADRGFKGFKRSRPGGGGRYDMDPDDRGQRPLGDPSGTGDNDHRRGSPGGGLYRL